ncbi:TlpA family protein disulfide reductase [bacterium]|nr:MAG: TlpA family protein disulfide reductase [bacterium]
MKYLIPVFLLVLTSCNIPNGQVIRFTFEPDQPTEIILESKPVHYKYAPKITESVSIKKDEPISYVNQSQVPRLVTLKTSDGELPLYLDGKSRLSVTILRANPDSMFVIEGYPAGLLETYYDLKRSEKPLLAALNRDKPAFLKGEPSAYLRILDDIQSNRKAVLSGTPYEFLYWQALGDWLVARLDWIFRASLNQKEAETIRKAVIQSAQNAHFFSRKSLENQVAGSRNFTNAWAHSFGIADSVRRIFGKETSIYDVNRLAYEALNKRRIEILQFIEDDKAQALTEMYLVAERLGEGNFKDAEKSMIRFVQKWMDSYPDYSNFVINFHKQIKRVQPGQAAFDFAFPNEKGDTLKLSHFKGKYVFLDFWASWCSPCLEEFPHMKTLYKKLDHSKIEFIGIGLDAEKDVWNGTISRLDLPWIQLYGGKEFENSLFKQYRGGGIPLVVLIDPNGKIARFDDVKASLNLEKVLKESGAL